MQFFCAGGKGGQNQNKVATACRIVHLASGAVGESRTYRTQLQNKKEAFIRLANSEKFKSWHKIEVARKLGGYIDINIREEDIKVEYI